MALTLSHYYVDPVGGNDADTGGIGDPWQTLQHALDNVVDGADGVQINLNDSGPDTLAASLDFSNYVAANGKSTWDKFFVLRGYTAAEGDGGIGEIDGNDGDFTLFDFAADDMQYVYLVDLELHNTGTAHVINSDSSILMRGCTVHTTDADAIRAGGYAYIQYCYLYAFGGAGIYSSVAPNTYVYNVIDATSGTTGIRLYNYDTAVGNAVLMGATGTYGINTSGFALNMVMLGNSIYDKDGGAGNIGIYLSSTVRSALVMNNILANLSGVGAIGIAGHAAAQGVKIGPNAFWNCTTDMSTADEVYSGYVSDTALGANPFVDAANLDFSLTATSTARNAAWPNAFLSGSTELYLDMGASQHVDPSGGGRRPRIRRHGV